MERKNQKPLLEVASNSTPQSLSLKLCLELCGLEFYL